MYLNHNLAQKRNLRVVGVVFLHIVQKFGVKIMVPGCFNSFSLMQIRFYCLILFTISQGSILDLCLTYFVSVCLDMASFSTEIRIFWNINDAMLLRSFLIAQSEMTSRLFLTAHLNLTALSNILAVPYLFKG